MNIHRSVCAIVGSLTIVVDVKEKYIYSFDVETYAYTSLTESPVEIQKKHTLNHTDIELTIDVELNITICSSYQIMETISIYCNFVFD